MVELGKRDGRIGSSKRGRRKRSSVGGGVTCADEYLDLRIDEECS